MPGKDKTNHCESAQSEIVSWDRPIEDGKEERKLKFKNAPFAPKIFQECFHVLLGGKAKKNQQSKH